MRRDAVVSRERNGQIVSELVTGEAVVLELRLAKVASRMLSVAIDVAAQVVLLIVGSLVIGGVAGSVDDAAAAAILAVFLVAVIVGYPVTFETLTRGRTLGKMALGLRVVREDGGPIRFRHALVRGLAAVIEIWLTVGAVALVVSLASSQGKRLGDFLAGTVVVRERVPSASAPMVAMPPMLAAWASGLDLSRLPDDLALAARQFLARAGELSPEVRESMGARLAASVAACTAPPPPPGVPPWAYLSAVLAERRRREAARLGVAPQPAYGAPPTSPWQAGSTPAYGAPPTSPWQAGSTPAYGAPERPPTPAPYTAPPQWPSPATPQPPPPQPTTPSAPPVREEENPFAPPR
jgi:uncharacterized RDD family membrane protein YckC